MTQLEVFVNAEFKDHRRCRGRRLLALREALDNITSAGGAAATPQDWSCQTLETIEDDGPEWCSAWAKG